jgi:hypothetical protein
MGSGLSTSYRQGITRRETADFLDDHSVDLQKILWTDRPFGTLNINPFTHWTETQAHRIKDIKNYV